MHVHVFKIVTLQTELFEAQCARAWNLELWAVSSAPPEGEIELEGGGIVGI